MEPIIRIVLLQGPRGRRSHCRRVCVAGHLHHALPDPRPPRLLPDEAAPPHLPHRPLHLPRPRLTHALRQEPLEKLACQVCKYLQSTRQ